MIESWDALLPCLRKAAAAPARRCQYFVCANHARRAPSRDVRFVRDHAPLTKNTLLAEKRGWFFLLQGFGISIDATGSRQVERPEALCHGQAQLLPQHVRARVGRQLEVVLARHDGRQAVVFVLAV